MTANSVAALARWVLLAGLGLIVAAVVLFWSTRGNPASFDCGGEALAPGDRCVTYSRGGEVGNESYEEIVAGRRASQEWASANTPVLGVVGVGLVVASSLVLVRQQRRTARTSEAAARDQDWWRGAGGPQ